MYITGGINGTNSSFGSTALASAGMNDVFVAKLTEAGASASFAWAQKGGGPGADSGTDLVVSGSAVYVAGFYSARSRFGSIALSGGTSQGDGLGFLARLTDSGPGGTWTWVQEGNYVSYSALVARGSDIYVGGGFRGPATFGSSAVWNAWASPDAYLAKFNDNGSGPAWRWGLRTTGPGSEGILTITLDGADIYVGGEFNGDTARFGSTNLLRTPGSGQYDVDIAVAKARETATGATWEWARQAGGQSYDHPLGLAVSGTTLYVGGRTTLPSSFGSIAITGPANTTVGYLAALDEAQVSSATAAGPAASVRLFPSPAHATATVELPARPGGGSSTLTVYDALGRAVRTCTVSSQRHSLDLAGLAPGVYAVRVLAGNDTAVCRLVVE